MRTGGTINTEAAASSSPFSSASAPVHSPWHSPIPYLFGGLAAMLGLIAFALLILACSYWKFSGFLESGDQEEESERDLENGDEKSTGEAIKVPAVYEQKIVVIMAGDEKPTFLATPIFPNASSFGDFNNENKEKEDKKSDETEKPKEENEEENGESRDQSENRETHETPHHHQSQ
ncbi:hypothetical protein BVC80_7517g2 [Macleaya cordata]|uniref:Uncharacterized protein n=1 Tax=Macleaya cordata TaxID=56857 RepID=A0A200QS55_MACCD|nr:hypothetical protein BVC80_7517g2 [Macleaya cordata]